MRFNLRQIEVFRAIMVTGSISGASRLLAVSQPAISRLLAHTEDRLGIKLFERTKGRVQPTPEARRLFDEVDEVHQGVLRINRLAEELREHSTGAMHIVASPSISQALVPRAIGRFRARHAAARIEFEILSLHDLVTKVVATHVDFGISVLPVDEPNIVCEPIASGRLTVVCPRGHPLASLDEIGPDDLAPYPLISYGPQTPYGMNVERALSHGRRAIHVKTIVRYTSVACALVQEGAGIAIVDEFVVRGGTWPDIVARPLLPATPVRIHLLTQRYRPLSRLTQNFISILREVVAEEPLQRRVRKDQES
jgi:DNA-binding transcriptional LysR family regulator